MASISRNRAATVKKESVGSIIVFCVHSPHGLQLKVCLDGWKLRLMDFLHCSLSWPKANTALTWLAWGMTQVMCGAVLCCVVASCVWCLAGQPAWRHLSSRNRLTVPCAFPAFPVLQCGTSSSVSEDGTVSHTNFPEANEDNESLLVKVQWRCNLLVMPC